MVTGNVYNHVYYPVLCLVIGNTILEFDKYDGRINALNVHADWFEFNYGKDGHGKGFQV